MELDEQIGKKLREIRKEKNLTMREAGEKSGVSYSQISRIENGHPASLQALKKLSDAYDVTLQSLFGEEVELPQKLKDEGVKWMAFGKKMEGKELTPEKVEEYVEAVRKLRGEE
ncbi:helix-turn-helix domain-containing protein [Virgibacillus salexigens]|uniref:helix-turn-helix domain-containing protein n=1 Tax=Virgibacillus salexigens TaxID=61016 RepID=UPI00190A6243|nr:helix-turn-helix transcriptional regulator [Virgibacillus salexigens]